MNDYTGQDKQIRHAWTVAVCPRLSSSSSCCIYRSHFETYHGARSVVCKIKKSRSMKKSNDKQTTTRIYNNNGVGGWCCCECRTKPERSKRLVVCVIISARRRKGRQTATNHKSLRISNSNNSSPSLIPNASRQPVLTRSNFNK